MADARAALRVWRRLVAARIRADWQYRTSFFLFLLSQTLIAALDLLVIAAIFGQVDTLAGWSGAEVALLYGLAGVGFGVADLLISAVERASWHIQQGTFDLFLLRPLPTLVHLSASEFALRRLGRVIQPVIVLAIALAVAPIEWGPEVVLLLPVTILSGVVIFGSVWVATSSVSFWTVESQEFGNAFTYGGGLAAQYPIDVLATWLQRLFTFLVPIAFVAYVPAARMLGREPMGVPSVAAWGTPAVAAASALVAGAVWGMAVRHHRSTGS